MMNLGELTFFCGKMGAGKSTKALEISTRNKSVLLSEDEWLLALYGDEVKSLKDYVTYSDRLKPLVKNLVQSLLLNGTNVVLDFPANTQKQREWFRSVFSEVGASHRLIYIDVPDQVCLEQIQKRRLEQPNREKTDTPEMFAQVSRYFEAPMPQEGFNVILGE